MVSSGNDLKPCRGLFIVGCPRSGTTLLQSLLNQHPDLTTFPESHIFTAACHALDYRMYRDLFSPLGRLKALRLRLLDGVALTTPRAARNFRRFFDERVAADKTIPTPDGADYWLKGRFFRATAAALDSVSPTPVWMEKTPQHVFVAREIERYVPGSRFIHIVREPTETIASLYDAYLKYEQWYWLGQGTQTLARITSIWNRSQAHARRCEGRGAHMFVHYEDLCESPTDVLAQCLRFAGLRDIALSERFSTDTIVFKHEAWKTNMGGAVARRPSKFPTLLSEAEQNEVQSLIDPDLRAWAQGLKQSPDPAV